MGAGRGLSSIDPSERFSSIYSDQIKFPSVSNRKDKGKDEEGRGSVLGDPISQLTQVGKFLALSRGHDMRGRKGVTTETLSLGGTACGQGRLRARAQASGGKEGAECERK